MAPVRTQEKPVKKQAAPVSEPSVWRTEAKLQWPQNLVAAWHRARSALLRRREVRPHPECAWDLLFVACCYKIMMIGGAIQAASLVLGTVLVNRVCIPDRETPHPHLPDIDGGSAVQRVSSGSVRGGRRFELAGVVGPGAGRVCCGLLGCDSKPELAETGRQVQGRPLGPRPIPGWQDGRFGEAIENSVAFRYRTWF